MTIGVPLAIHRNASDASARRIEEAEEDRIWQQCDGKPAKRKLQP
eukprot:CAMPEP_0119356832 /NCGR_PEP_ID=MMETSP1334-20130426/5348_1 /TAXON_ID=127549 /ORGANISM="Calcidiscus leptoporus, Strain RCC1130" /LENGTH=44 /DNA_ID= /DNA_START= /DNA_END= /DNA_ORIENTATION=